MDEFEREWRSRFEKFATRHAEDHFVSGWSRQGLRRRLTAVGHLIRDNLGDAPLRILDLGCGAGTYVRFLGDLGHHVIGFDYSRPSLRRAQEADRLRQGQYVEGEAYGLPFRPGSFDLVIAVGIFQALGHPERAIEQVLLALRPGGWTILETLNAVELISIARRTLRRLRGRPDPVRAYSPHHVKDWLSTRGARPIRQVGIYLAPRGLAGLEPIFREGALPALLGAVPGAALLTAHAILTLARKET